MKRAALYIRVSTQEQAQEGYSIGAQKERLFAYCKAHDWLVGEVYIDGGFSGSNLNRPGIQRLLSEIDNFDVVLVYKLDRLSRSQRDTLYLIEDSFLPHKVDFVSMQESFDTATPFGKAMIGLLAVFAQLEREQIKERTRMGRMERAKAGLHQGGGIIPIGYDYREGKLIINPYEARIVKRIFELYLCGMSLHSVADNLKAEGFTSRTGKFYEWSSVRNILRNPTYLGHLHYCGIVVENTHDALITKEQFQAAQDLIEKRGRAAGNRNRIEYLLTGIIYCGCCGTRYHHRNNCGYNYYSCYSRTKDNSKMIKDPNCTNKHWRCEKLESIVEVEICKVLKSPKLAAEISAAKQAKPLASELNLTATKRIKELNKQIDKLMDLYQSEDIPPAVLSNSISKLYKEKESLETALAQETAPKQTKSFDLVEELLKNAAQIWDFADCKQKRNILRSIVNKITLTNEKVDIEWAF